MSKFKLKKAIICSKMAERSDLDTRMTESEEISAFSSSSSSQFKFQKQRLSSQKQSKTLRNARFLSSQSVIQIFSSLHIPNVKI